MAKALKSGKVLESALEFTKNDCTIVDSNSKIPFTNDDHSVCDSRDNSTMQAKKVINSQEDVHDAQGDYAGIRCSSSDLHRNKMLPARAHHSSRDYRREGELPADTHYSSKGFHRDAEHLVNSNPKSSYFHPCERDDDGEDALLLELVQRSRAQLVEMYGPRVCPNDAGTQHHPSMNRREPDGPSHHHSAQTDEMQRRFHHSSSFRKQIEPEKYDGNASIESYLERFDEVAEWNEWTEEEKVMQLIMHLTGSAKVTVKLLPCKERKSYYHICKTLRESFSCRRSAFAIQQEFWNKMKSSKQSLPEFANELRTLSYEAFSMMMTGESGVRAVEDMLINKFVSCLGDVRLGRYIYLQHPVSLRQAVSIAKDYHMFDSMAGALGQKPRPNTNLIGKYEVEPVNCFSEVKEMKEVVVELRSAVQLLAEENRELQEDFTDLQALCSEQRQEIDCLRNLLAENDEGPEFEHLN